MAAQELRQLDPGVGDDVELYYWQRAGGRLGEVDYRMQVGSRIVPIELKAGATGAMKSLHQFMFDKRLTLAVRCDGNRPSVMDVAVKTTQGDPVSYKLVSVPLYLLWNLEAIVADAAG